MENKNYLIYRYEYDDSMQILGYIFGTEKEANTYCDKLNEAIEHEWEYYEWMKLDRLNP